MATRFSVLTLVLMIAACSTLQPASNPTPTTSPARTSPTPSPPVTDYLQSVRLTSSSVVWAETTTRVLRSTDRGLHWNDITPSPHGTSGSFFALDDNTAWFVTLLSPGSGSDIYRTVDGGQTWARSGAALPISGLESLDFVDSIHGWATVNLGAAAGSEAVAVLTSNDSGASWRRIADTGDPANPSASPSASGLTLSCDKTVAVFGSKSVGLLPVQCPGGRNYVYRTRDGGFHWTPFDLPSVASVSIFSDAEFLTANDVVLTGPQAVILVSHDGGITWRDYSLPGTGSVAFESVDLGWQLDAQIQMTIDGGVTWRPLNVPAPPFKASDMALQLLGSQVALAWSPTAVYRTDDGAQTWSDITPPQKSA